MRTLVIACFALLSFVASPALAQFDANSFTDAELSIELQPQFPRPGETVTATLNDYAGGVYGSSISWYLDGQTIPEAANQRQATLTAGQSGTSQKIEIVLTRPGGTEKVLTTTIRPVYLDIIIEPQTHVPDFYLGRALPSIGSSVNATALISGEGFRNPDLVYTWQLNQIVLEGGSIRGRNKVSFETPMGKQSTLSLQVTELNGTVLARRAILIPSVTPEIHFYEVSSLFGIRQTTLNKSFSLIGNTAVVRAEPYHLDSRVYNNPAIHEWKIDRTAVADSGGNPYEVTLQRVGAAGISNLQFHVRDTAQVLQGTKADVDINF